MSHESVITGLKRLIKRDLLEIEPKDHVDHLFGESPRSTIILEASTVEASILHILKGKMPTLNNDERERIFNFEGPCGSFSNRIRMAQGLGVFDRTTRRSIELIKEMRNAAAHCHAPISFETVEIREAVLALFPSVLRSKMQEWEARRIRVAFSLICSEFCMSLTDPEYEVNAQEAFDKCRPTEMPRASPEKPSGASHQSRRRAKKDK